MLLYDFFSCMYDGCILTDTSLSKVVKNTYPNPNPYP